jgi:hypothetical protein
MIFEGIGLNFTMPLDPMEARRYVEPARRDMDNLYKMTMHMDGYVNATTDDAPSWRSIISCASKSEERIE